LSPLHSFHHSPSALFSSFFFFSCSAHHRDLHSFPTRRSSDLVAPERVVHHFPAFHLHLDEVAVGQHRPKHLLGGAIRLEVQVERSEEHTSELQSRGHLVCRLLLEKKKKKFAHLINE